MSFNKAKDSDNRLALTNPHVNEDYPESIVQLYNGTLVMIHLFVCAIVFFVCVFVGAE